MFDVLPPQGIEGDEPKPDSRRVGQGAASRRPEAVAGAAEDRGPRTVTIHWKLPARLRRPIRQELAFQRRQRAKKKIRQQAVLFTRRPVRTQHVMGRSDAHNVGAEHHTSDVYRQSQPAIRVALPPYRGGYIDRKLASGQERRTAASQMKGGFGPPQGKLPRRLERRQLSGTAKAASRGRGAMVTAASRSPRTVANVSNRRSEAVAGAVGERDIPFRWNDYGERKTTNNTQQLFVEKPKGRVRSAFSISFWPFNRKSSLRWLGLKGKKKLRLTSPGNPRARYTANLGLLLVGCMLAYGLVWSLQGAGRGTLVFGSVQRQASMAYDRLLAAQEALAETDFKTSEDEFAEAEALLAQARQNLDEALASSRIVLKYVDLTGTVRSGEQLLKAGQELTRAGQYISRGLESLMAAEVLADTSLVEAIEVSQEEFGRGAAALNEAETALSDVGSPWLPADIRRHVQVLQSLVPTVRDALQGYLDRSDMLLRVLGADQGRQYLLLFTNNHEIRPTGGFIGSIALINVDRGRVEEIDVQSVYHPDGQLKEFIAPPDPLLAITNRWYLRDANWFVDYETSAGKIAQFFEKEGGPTVDGVLSITPEVIRSLLEVTGPIEVPEYGVVVSADTFVATVQEQVTYEYDKELNRPKQFLADLTPLLLNRLFDLSGEVSEGDQRGLHLVMALRALALAAEHKDLLLYFRDDSLQQQLEKVGWAGKVPAEQSGLVYVNNANIGGHKSDQFIDQEIDYRAEIKPNWDVEVVLTIRRTHRGPQEAFDYDYPENEDPAYKDNIIYQRVLVPQGAKLLDARGFSRAAQVPVRVIREPELELTVDPLVADWQTSQKADTTGTMVGEEAGYTSFANWMVTKPGETTVGLYRYVLPGEASQPNLVDTAKQYTMYMVKQPGAERTMVRASLSLPEGVRIVHAVPREGIMQESARELVYRGALTRDRLIGAVFEPD